MERGTFGVPLPPSFFFHTIISWPPQPPIVESQEHHKRSEASFFFPPQLPFGLAGTPDSGLVYHGDLFLFSSSPCFFLSSPQDFFIFPALDVRSRRDLVKALQRLRERFFLPPPLFLLIFFPAFSPKFYFAPAAPTCPFLQ